MDRLSALSRGTQLTLAASVLLLIDTFLPWQKYDGEGSEFAEALGADLSRNAWHGFWGVLLGLLTVALVAWLVAEVTGMEIKLPVSATMLTAVLAGVILLCTVLKVLTDDFRGWAAWLGLLLALALAFGAWLRVQEGGGVDTLRAEASSFSSRPADSGTTTGAGHGAPATTDAPAPPPPSTPAPSASDDHTPDPPSPSHPTT